jgi:hypothetical protein
LAPDWRKEEFLREEINAFLSRAIVLLSAFTVPLFRSAFSAPLRLIESRQVEQKRALPFVRVCIREAMSQNWCRVPLSGPARPIPCQKKNIILPDLLVLAKERPPAPLPK